MEKDNRLSDYRNIRNLQELQYCRRLLSSRIDHQEIMVMYKLRCVWEFISPSNLLDMGCKAIALQPMSSRLEGDMNSHTQRSLYMTIIS